MFVLQCVYFQKFVLWLSYLTFSVQYSGYSEYETMARHCTELQRQSLNIVIDSTVFCIWLYCPKVWQYITKYSQYHWGKLSEMSTSIR